MIRQSSNRRHAGSVPAGPAPRRICISVACPPEGLPKKTPHVDTDISPQSQLPPLTAHPLGRRTALPWRHRAIPTQLLRFQIVSGAIAKPSIHVGVPRELTAFRNAPRTPLRSRALHSTTLNRGPIPAANRL